jgi:type I restriction enzyme, S subunit
MGQDVCLLRVNPAIALPNFVQLALSGPSATHQFEASMAGSTFKRLNVQQIKQIRLDLPDRPQQVRIAEAIERAEDVATCLEQLIAKKETIKHGMAQELLAGRSRLAGFEQEWRTRFLSDLLSYEQPTPYLVASTDYAASGTPVLTAGKTFLLGYTRDRQGVYNATPVIIFDDFTTDSKFVTFPFKAKSSAMKILSAKPGGNIRYLYERMQLINFVAIDHKRRWISEYSKIEIEIPDEDEQTAIAGVLTDADREIDVLRLRLNKAKAIKQGMAQQLLSGRVRLPVLEAVA